MTLHVTSHAILRYQERVKRCTDAEAVTALTGPIFDKAIEVGAHVVILPAGQRAIIKNSHVITVLPKGVHVFTASTYHRGDL